MTIMILGKINPFIVYHVNTDKLYFSPPRGKTLYRIVLSEHPTAKFFYDQNDFSSLGHYMLKNGTIIDKLHGTN